MSKKNILIVIIVLMAVGFASMTANLIINGSATIGNNTEDYDIKFTKATLDREEDNSLIKENGKKISYETKQLENKDDYSELVYEITNNSKLYDASVSITCAAKGTITHTNLYTIDTTNTPDKINAQTSKTGSIKITLTNETTETIREEFECTLNVQAIEKTDVGVNTGELIYGVRRLIDSTETTWERIEDSVGLVANATHDGSPVKNDFDSIYPWSDIITYNYDDTTHQETAVFGDSNFSFDGSNGQVLTRIPEFYYKREQKDGYEYIYISKTNQEGYSHSDTFSVGRYTMSGDSNHIYSKNGTMPITNTNINDVRTYARNLGKDENDNYYFGLLDWRYFIIQLLYLVEYADYNSQSMLGLGNVNNSGPIGSGGCDTLGMKSGTLNNDGQHSMIYRGIEDLYGNIWQFVDGINIKDHVAYINYNYTTYQVDKFDGDYQMLGYTNATSDGFVTSLGYDANHPLISFPTRIRENQNISMGDYYWQSSGNKIALVGGRYTSNFYAGLYYWDLNMALSDEMDNIGARLLRYQ